MVNIDMSSFSGSSSSDSGGGGGGGYCCESSTGDSSRNQATGGGGYQGSVDLLGFLRDIWLTITGGAGQRARVQRRRRSCPPNSCRLEKYRIRMKEEDVSS